MEISEFRQRYIDAMKMSERATIAELFRLADHLEAIDKSEDNCRILADVFSYLCYYTKAYNYLLAVANPHNVKDAKKVIEKRKTVLLKCRVLNIVPNR